MLWQKQDRRRRRLVDLGIALGACILAATGLTGCSAAAPHSDAQEVADLINTTTVTYHGQAPQDVPVPPGATGVLTDAIGGGGGASAIPDGVQTDRTGGDTGAPNLGGGDAGTNPEPSDSNPDFAVWQGSRGHGPAGGLAGVSSNPPFGGIGGQGASGGGSGGGGGGGFQSGYGGNGASSYGGDGSGGGAGSTGVAVQVSSGVIVAPAPESFRSQNGQVTLTWLSS